MVFFIFGTFSIGLIEFFDSYEEIHFFMNPIWSDEASLQQISRTSSKLMYWWMISRSWRVSENFFKSESCFIAFPRIKGETKFSLFFKESKAVFRLIAMYLVNDPDGSLIILVVLLDDKIGVIFLALYLGNWLGVLLLCNAGSFVFTFK